MRSAGAAAWIFIVTFIPASCLPVPEDSTWDHFVFTQFWPQTQCYFPPLLGDGGPHGVASNSCVPSGVTNWTIHGLWPTVHDEEHKPTYCNKSWPFNMAEIEDLRPRLEIHWPTYEKGDPEGFWKHEWDKHGTCATSLSSMDSEHKYFSIGLALNAQYDLRSVLATAGIMPSKSDAYWVKDMEMAIAKAFGVKAKVFCQVMKGGDQFLSSLELCLDKTNELTPINCYNTTAICDYNKQVLYPPIVPKSIQT